MAPTPTQRRSPLEPATPQPFWKSSEFKLMFRLGALLLVVGALAVYLLLFTKASSTSAAQGSAASAPAAKPALTAEQLAERQARLYSMYEGALADAQNGEDVERETAGYLRLLRMVSDFAPEEVTRRSSRWLDHADALADPDAWRGEWVRVRGLIRGLETVPLSRTDYGGNLVYRGLVVQEDSEVVDNRRIDRSTYVLFDLPEHPGDIQGLANQAFDAEGLFYRTATYVGRQGHTRTVPWVIVRNLRPVPTSHEDRYSWLNAYGPYIAGGVALLLAGLLVYALRRRPRPRAPARPATDESIREMFERRLREEGSPPPPSVKP